MTLTRRVSTLCSAGDEGPAALAIVQASPTDCGLYRCTIQNEHGSASTDFRLSPEGECLVGGISADPVLLCGRQHCDVQGWGSAWTDNLDSSALFFSTQYCLASSPERKVKVCWPSGLEGKSSSPARPFAGFLTLGVYNPS